MDLGPNTTSTLVVVALLAAVVALVAAAGLYQRLSGIQARYRILWAGGEKDLIAVLSHQSGQIADLRRDLEMIRAQVSLTAADVGQGLRHVGVVRYDVLGDMSGRPSFSAAIIDDHGDGLVISSVQERGESHSYAKGVVRGAGHITLTFQEQQAIDAARTGKGAE